MERAPGPLEREDWCSHDEQVQVVREGVTNKEVFRELFLDCSQLFRGKVAAHCKNPLEQPRPRDILIFFVFQDLNRNSKVLK